MRVGLQGREGWGTPKNLGRVFTRSSDKYPLLTTEGALGLTNY